MPRTAQLAISLLISAALASPVLAQGRAVSRGSAGTSSGSSGAGSSGSGGGSSGGSSSGTEARPPAVTMPPLPDRPTANSDQGSGQRTRPTGSSSSGSATTRPSGGSKVSGGGSSSTSSSGGAETRSRSGGNTGSSAGAGSVSGQRNRGDRPVVGLARDRSTIDRPSLPIVIAPWTHWYPWYSGLGWNFGYVTYGPYGYGRSRWLWGPYGWYDPWDYDPYYSPSYRERYEEEGYRESESRRLGSIRLRANPDSAQVFIDGALVGVVDDFNGMSNHLELEGGTHTIELRAEGYQPYTGEINVKVGKTLTERISLKKK